MAKKASFNDLETAIKKGNIEPIYFFYGKEDFFIEELIERLKQKLCPTEADLATNYTALYGQDISVGDLLSAASSYGMFAERRLVVVKGFERIRKERTKDKLKAQMESLAAFVRSPMDSTVLVLAAGDLDKKDLAKEPYTLLESVSYEFGAMKDAAGFATERAKALGWTLLPDASKLLMQYVGGSVRDLAAELQKLALFADGRAEKTLTAQDVMQTVGVSRDYNVFELEKAIYARDLRQASGIALMMLDKGEEPIAMLNFLTVSLMRLWKLQTPSVRLMSDGDAAKELGMYGGQAYFLRDYRSYAGAFSVSQIQSALIALHEADLELKGQGSLTATSADERDKLLMLVLLRKILS